MNVQELKAAAKSFGADLIGISGIERFAELSPESNPLSIFPQAKSMIVIGRRILHSTLSALDIDVNNTAPFKDYSLNMLEDQYLAKTTYDLCMFIERHNLEAVPMFGYDVEAIKKFPVMGVAVSPDKPAPNVYVDWKIAADLCGLGKIGKNGLFITPEFGVCQRFAMLLSDGEFEADEFCSTDFCNNCNACSEACERNAIDDNGVNLPICENCSQGAMKTNFGRFNAVDRIPAACGRACQRALNSRKNRI